MQSLPHGFDVGHAPAGHAPAGPEDPNRRACDQCRMRKVRCDKDYPCSNCRTAKRPCTSTGVGQRPKEPRQRVLISSQYEKKIDQIEARLGNIESLLKNISAGVPTQGHTSRQSSTPRTGSSGIPTGSSTVGFDSSDEESAFGGDSGFTNQSTFASEFLEHAVERTSLRDANPGIESALANLRQLAEVHKYRSVSHGPRFPLQKPLPPGGLADLPMPPVEAVIRLLKKRKSGPPSLFSFACTLSGIVDLSGLCRLVYFPTEDFSQATYAIVNTSLYNLFMEEAVLCDDEARRDEYHSYAVLAQANLETCLAHLPLFLSAKVETVQALLLGAQYAIDMCRPSVAWHLNTTAAQLCQTAGFHRAECADADQPQLRKIKTILFWQVYTWDRGLGLRLGRSPVIKDSDISIPREFDFSGFLPLEESDVARHWLRTAMIQGRIYEELYSPSALREDPGELSRRARELAVDCRRLESEAMVVRNEVSAYFKSTNTSSLIEVFVKGDEVQLLTTLTLVYRAIPAPEGSPSRFCDECLDSARRAMRAHKESMSTLHLGSYVKSIYVHWNLMLTPFAPFFVIFCHVVETLSGDDLRILEEFVASIETLRDASETIEKLYRVFQVYRDVAVVYVEAKSQQQEDQTMVPIGDEFDMYLSQLGFMPVDDPTMVQASQPSTNTGNNTSLNPMHGGGGQAAQMADWFSGSRNMFGLLEEDLSQFDATRWMPPPGA